MLKEQTFKVFIKYPEEVNINNVKSFKELMSLEVAFNNLTASDNS